MFSVSGDNFQKRSAKFRGNKLFAILWDPSKPKQKETENPKCSLSFQTSTIWRSSDERQRYTGY